MADKRPKTTDKSRSSSRKPRLNGPERRDLILGKAVDLVREKGKKVTTRMLAQEAQISEALLYQHFASKDELFRELADILESKAPSLQKYFVEATPSSRLLVDYLYMTAYLALHPTLQKRESNLPRLLLESLLGDGHFVRTHVQRRWNGIKDCLTLSYQAAKESGDIPLKENENAEDLNLLFSHQLVMMIHCFCHVPREPVMQPNLPLDALVDHAVLFLLRGLGYKQSSINKLFQPEKILSRFTAVLK